MFVGVHERQLDDKGRLALPSAFRSMLGDACYLVHGDDGCINVYSTEAFEATGADMMARVRNGDVTLTRARALAHSATKVTLDKQGRVTVDDKLRGYAHLQPGSKVVVAGAFEWAEVWSEERYEHVAAEGRGELAGGQG